MAMPVSKTTFLLVTAAAALFAGACTKKSSKGGAPAPNPDTSGLPGGGSMETGNTDQNGNTGNSGNSQGGPSTGQDGSNSSNGTNQGTNSNSQTDGHGPKHYPGDYKNDLDNKKVQEIFTPTKVSSSFQVMTVTRGAWLETLDGRTQCHIGFGRTFWSVSAPIFRAWPSNDELVIEVDLENDFFVDVLKFYDGGKQQFTTQGKEGGSAIQLCPVKGNLYVRIPRSDFVSLSHSLAFDYTYPNHTAQVLATTQETTLTNTYAAAGQKQTQGCTIPANTVFPVTFKVGQGSAGAAAIPVELLRDVPGATGDMCRAGTMGFIPAAHAMRVL